MGDPRETKEAKKVRDGVKTEFKVAESSKFLAIQATSTLSVSGLKLDLPFVEGEGDIFNVGGTSQDAKAKFTCRLLLPNAENKTWPKVRDDLTSASAYFDAKDEDTLPTASIKDIESWVKEIKGYAGGELYAAIRDKDVTLLLEGNTSKSGSKDYNAKLANRRIDAVARILKKGTNFGGGVDLASIPKAQSKYEEKHDYRVDVSFDKVKAMIALKARE
jgi:outer membrane protein OmpA-like peptidoglycan-associated protein